MKTHHRSFVAARLLAASLLLAPAAFAQEGTATSESPAVHSLRQTLSTEAYTGILESLVNPATLSNPVAVCANCHNGEDVARFSSALGPMLQMVNPVNWVNPMAYWNMAVPMMDPQTYSRWYDAYIKKYGPLLGYDAAGTPAAPSTTE